MSKAAEFVDSFEPPLSDGSCLEDRMTVIGYLNFLIKGEGRPGRVVILGDDMVYVSPSLRIEMTTDRIVSALAGDVKSSDQLVQVLDSVGRRFMEQLDGQGKTVFRDFDKGSISLYLMNSSQVSRLETDMRDRNVGQTTAPYDMPIFLPHDGDLVLSPTIDILGNRVPVTEAICAAMGMEKNSLFEVGMANLAKLTGIVELDTRTLDSGVHVIESEMPPASSLMLSSSFWEKKTSELGSAPALRVINGDVIAFAPSGDRAAVEALTTGKGFIGGLGVKPISNRIYVWSAGALQKHKAA